MKYIWQKPYVGPFSRALAESLVKELKDFAAPDVNAIYDAKIRKRARSRLYDVFVKTTP